MGMVPRRTTISTLIVCLLAAPLCNLAGASEPVVASPNTSLPARSLSSSIARVDFLALPESARSQHDLNAFRPSVSTEAQPGYGYYRRGGRNHTAATAMILGATAAITGTALLVYANRPECSSNVNASACGYGTKVIGGSVLAGGVAGIAIGAALWR